MTLPQAFVNSYPVSLFILHAPRLLMVGMLTRWSSPLPLNPQACNRMPQPARLFQQRVCLSPPTTSFNSPRPALLCFDYFWIKQVPVVIASIVLSQYDFWSFALALGLYRTLFQAS